MARYIVDPHQSALGSLRAEIREAGRRIGRTSAAIFVLTGVVPAAGGCVCRELWLEWNPLMSLWPGVVYPAAGATLLFAAGLAVENSRRSALRAWLRRRLNAMPPQDREQVLLPLRSEKGEARRIVAPLVHEFRVGNNLVPAEWPVGRGTEVAASGLRRESGRIRGNRAEYQS